MTAAISIRRRKCRPAHETLEDRTLLTIADLASLPLSFEANRGQVDPGVDFFTRLVTGDLRPEDLDSDSESVGLQRMTDNMAVRTKFFD